MPLVLSTVAAVLIGALVNRRWILCLPPGAALILALVPNADPSGEDQSQLAAVTFFALAIGLDLALSAGIALRRLQTRRKRRAQGR